MHSRRIRALGYLALGFFASQHTLRAQGFEIVHSFTYGQGQPYGALIEAPDGRIFGTSQTGGDFDAGSVFVLTPDGSGGYGYAELHSFRGVDGSAPTGALYLAPDGTLFGVCNAGGASGIGSIYEIDAGGSFTSLHDFISIPDGQNPLGGLVAGSDGYLYGLCSGGGSLGYGTFYRIDGNGTFERLYDFGAPGGSLYPQGELVATAEGFYGVAYAGGASSNGTIFLVDAGGTLTTLHEFSGADGANPTGGLVLLSGKLYGTTSTGGDSSDGTVFSLDPTTQDFQTLHSFAFGEGQEPLGRLIASGGLLYGTAFDGGTNQFGTVFVCDPGTGVTTTLHNFQYGEGANPKAGLMASAGGDFFGTTFNGTTHGWGTVFRMNAAGATTTLYFFQTTTALYPLGLSLASSGDLVGAASGGGTGGWGMLFRLSPADGLVTDLRSFTSSPDGAYPNSPLLEDGGFFYATTGGGANGIGTICRVDAAGNNYEDLHDFVDATEGSTPVAGLMKASDGNYYGTTLLDGAGGQGIVYQMNDQFAVTRIHSFAGSEGSQPRGTLVEGSDGKLYGMTSGGNGGAYRVDTSGTLEPLHAFDPSTEGTTPLAGLLLASNGQFYGTLSTGGNPGYGSVFQMDGSGAVSVLYSFTGNAGGGLPQSTLLEGDSGSLIGAAFSGGAQGAGFVFHLDTGSNLTKLHDFRVFDGEGPAGDLVRTASGDVYGVTQLGGPGGFGVVFHISPTPLTPSVTALQPSSGRASGGTSVQVVGDHLPADPIVVFDAEPGRSPLDLDAQHLLTISFSFPPGTLHDVSVSSASGGPTATLAAAWFADFTDVPQSYPFHDEIESLFRSGVTAGCLPGGDYCPDATVSRAEMAVFLLKAEHGNTYVPPPCAGVFADVPCPGGFAVDWIEKLAAEGITGGCAAGLYCPADPVTRSQAAVLLLKTEHGTSYVPPACTGVFSDVECMPIPAFAVDWIEELYHEGITGGCGGGNYCPGSPVTRGQMAVFLVRAFQLP
jgi:uncharacterized repeat protein (TIGR03803 family)